MTNLRVIGSCVQFLPLSKCHSWDACIAEPGWVLGSAFSLRRKTPCIFKFWVNCRVPNRICMLLRTAWCEAISLSRNKEKIKAFFSHWFVGSYHMIQNFCWWFSSAAEDLVKFPEELKLHKVIAMETATQSLLVFLMTCYGESDCVFCFFFFFNLFVLGKKVAFYFSDF